MSKSVAILRCSKFPAFVTWEIPDPEIYFEEDRMLKGALEKLGVEADLIAWDAEVDWSYYATVIIRSTWDYIDRLDEFLMVLEHIEAAGCRLINSVGTVRWNSDKHYLLDLQDKGIPIVPTFFPQDITFSEINTALGSFEGREAVIKASVGGGGANVYRVALKDLEVRYAELSSQYPRLTFLVQPLIESIITEGEWSYVFIGDKLIHTLLKKPGPGDFRIHVFYGGSMAPAEADEADRKQVIELYTKLNMDVAFARIDVVRLNGQLVIMELELIEPFLYFELAPEAADLLAKTISIKK